MGPVRGGLILAFVWVPQAWAEVCDKERPLWARADGPATALDEAIGLWTSPIGLLLAAVAVLAIMTGFRLLQAVIAFLVAAFAAGIAIASMSDPTAIRVQAVKEGCIGPPYLFLLSCAAICGLMITLIWRATAPAR